MGMHLDIKRKKNYWPVCLPSSCQIRFLIFCKNAEKPLQQFGKRLGNFWQLRKNLPPSPYIFTMTTHLRHTYIMPYLVSSTHLKHTYIMPPITNCIPVTSNINYSISAPFMVIAIGGYLSIIRMDGTSGSLIYQHDVGYRDIDGARKSK
jgi:hypothetical protein